ncbi:MAG: hypothetical protein J6S06_02440 [Alphaproteobacteria bacterium]|nr:hypothetical protein [Alphaproteobacteria bacterium]
MLNKKFVFAVSLVAMMAVSNAWASEPATGETVSTKHSVFTAYTPTEAGSKAGIAGVTYVNRAVNSAGNAATAAEIHAAASGAYAIDAKTAAEQANSAAAAAQAASAAAQETASEGVNKAKAAQQTADTANATANKNKTDIASIMTEQATQNTNISNLQTAVAGKQGTLKAGTNISISDDNTISSTYTYTLPTATDDVAGGMKLYTASGTATDGTMTQKAITDLVDLETGNVLEEAQGIVDNLETRVNANTTNISNLQTTVAGKQGTLKAGTNISISADNTISSTYTYTLPTATASVKGGVTIGSNIGVSSGKISVADATATTKGVSVLGVIPSGGTGSAATGTATIWVE